MFIGRFVKEDAVNKATWNVGIASPACVAIHIFLNVLYVSVAIVDRDVADSRNVLVCGEPWYLTDVVLVRPPR